jgi:outer membrane cobalamin receptor
LKLTKTTTPPNGSDDQNLFVREKHPAKLSVMIKPLYILLLSTCSATLAGGGLTGTRTSENDPEKEPNILVNAQGLAQHDLSIRGSGYSGSGISINGLNLKVPYSAHFNAELPFAIHLLSAPETQTGLRNVSGHRVGTASFSTVPLGEGGQISVGIGTEEYYSGNVSAFSSGTGGFLDREKAREVDHNTNDHDRYAGGAHVQHFVNDWQLDLIGGGQKKEFGAQGYYGIPSSVYAEEETEDALLFFGATHGEPDDMFFRTSTAWRQFDDEYRIPASNYVSDVRSRLGAVAIEGRTLEVQHIALNLRGDFEYEESDHHDRTRGSVLVLPEARFERFTLKAGLNSVFQSSESAEWLPQAGIDWFAGDNVKLYAAYSENVQQPDFQTLYHSDPFRSGNSGLNLQKSKNSELGCRQFLSENLDWRVAAFHRRAENASDWIRNSAVDTAWTATDLGHLDTLGVEGEINFYPSDELELSVFYQWIEKDDYNFYAGLYELDYPEHMLNLAGHWKFSPDFTLFGEQYLRRQTENNHRTSNDFGANASLGLHWFPRFAHNARLSFRVDNLWGSDFEAIPGLKPRGLSASTGIVVQW